ncbi:MAG: hypothetical protein AAGB26_05305 [Planctomycetota bacterium]
MKSSLVCLLCLLILGSCQHEHIDRSSSVQSRAPHLNPSASSEVRQGVSYLFPDHFGSSFNFTAELVEKNNTYYDQNLVEAPFRLKVISIKGKATESSFMVEPSFPQGIPEGLAIGDTVRWHGFERLRSVGQLRIEGKSMPQINLHYVSQLVILPEQKTHHQDGF